MLNILGSLLFSSLCQMMSGVPIVMLRDAESDAQEYGIGGAIDVWVECDTLSYSRLRWPSLHCSVGVSSDRIEEPFA